jgi:formylglycine-generating enzyme
VRLIARAAIAIVTIASAIWVVQARPASEHIDDHAVYAEVPGASLRTTLPIARSRDTVEVKSFRLNRKPVTNAEFLAFVRAQPQWQRGRAPAIFADANYLQQWRGALDLGPSAHADQPVTDVSWFAAQAYCEAHGARLPTWHEWELAAAADERRRDARDDPAWRERLLAWYSRPSNAALNLVGKTAPNVYGVYDLHGLVWEWVEDFNALMVSNDNREQGDPDLTKFCGAGALSVADRENYAVLMRVAMLSSLQANDTTKNLGFRCAKDLPKASR